MPDPTIIHFPNCLTCIQWSLPFLPTTQFLFQEVPFSNSIATPTHNLSTLSIPLQ
ncbi:hypothetical protein Fmac_024022 [Flemingia macrophylla]|uniref:Uncharacterized protein n=1 Tax=Flemingia macrophylla TaxID=520843 RepID=A0ABD1LN87_9FABA